MSRDIWIGFFGMTVESSNTILPSCNYAYVNALAAASDRNEFVSKVKTECGKLHFMVDEIEDVELFSERENKSYLNKELLELYRKVKNSTDVVFTTFHGSY